MGAEEQKKNQVVINNQAKPNQAKQPRQANQAKQPTQVITGLQGWKNEHPSWFAPQNAQNVNQMAQFDFQRNPQQGGMIRPMGPVPGQMGFNPHSAANIQETLQRFANTPSHAMPPNAGMPQGPGMPHN